MKSSAMWGLLGITAIDALTAGTWDGPLWKRDLGRLDAAGRLIIVGRKKDIIIRGGRNIHPAKIEDLARALEDWPKDQRIAIVASGGLSHFIIDEELDRCGPLDALLVAPHGAGVCETQLDMDAY